MSVIDEVAAERGRQIEAEGYSTAHDDQHDDGSMAMAAACYAAPRQPVGSPIDRERGPMTLAAQLAKRALRPAPIPRKVQPLLRTELERELAASAAVMALADRFRIANASFRHVRGWALGAPPLTDNEWMQIAELMADGKLPIVHSSPELQRAIMRAAAVKPYEPYRSPAPGWLVKRRERNRQRRGGA